MKIQKGKEFSYIGSNFKEWFGDVDFPTISDIKPLLSKKLPRTMIDKEIFAELKPTEVTLSEMYKTLETLSHDDLAIFYIRDKENILRTVDVGWYDGGWGVGADAFPDPRRWRGGGQVFSRNFFDTLNPDPLTLSPSDALEKAIALCKENGLVVTKTY